MCQLLEPEEARLDRRFGVKFLVLDQKIHRNHVLGLQDFWVGNFEKNILETGNVWEC